MNLWFLAETSRQIINGWYNSGRLEKQVLHLDSFKQLFSIPPHLPTFFSLSLPEIHGLLFSLVVWLAWL